MLQTYRAILQNGQIRWQGDAPPDGQAMDVYVTVLKSAPATSGHRGDAMAAALQKLADRGGIAGIGDPLEWQRETRQDRGLPGRDE